MYKNRNDSHQIDINKLAGLIDHTLLKPDASHEQIKILCNEALKYNFESVCINPANVFFVKEYIRSISSLPGLEKKDSGNIAGTSAGKANFKIKICSVIGFPLGASTTKIKVLEAEDAIENGANEIDMVINIGALKSEDYKKVSSDIDAVIKAAGPKILVKVIVETCLLSRDEKITICEIVRDSGADFIKTSTGFSLKGASIDDIKLMRSILGNKFGIKASGGISDYKSALSMIEAAGSIYDPNLFRLGTSKSVAIMEQFKQLILK